ALGNAIVDGLNCSLRGSRRGERLDAVLQHLPLRVLLGLGGSGVRGIGGAQILLRRRLGGHVVLNGLEDARSNIRRDRQRLTLTCVRSQIESPLHGCSERILLPIDRRRLLQRQRLQGVLIAQRVCLGVVV